MITDEYADKLYAEIYQKNLEITRLRAENERLRGAIHALEAKAIEHHQENVHRAEWRGSDNAQRKAKAVVARSGMLLSDIRKIAKAALKGTS